MERILVQPCFTLTTRSAPYHSCETVTFAVARRRANRKAGREPGKVLDRCS